MAAIWHPCSYSLWVLPAPAGGSGDSESWKDVAEVSVTSDTWPSPLCQCRPACLVLRFVGPKGFLGGSH